MPITPDLRIAIVAGEHSGDQLGGKLLASMRQSFPPFTTVGVGGEAMAAQGHTSFYPLADVAVMGPVAILKALPRLVSRVYSAVDQVLAFDPHLVVIIDSPEFTHPIAKRIRKRRPEIPIIDYVSPTVWAWRPGRAKKMAPYVDHLLALLPFEPAAHARLGGPRCTYVGHPLVERLDWIKAQDFTALRGTLAIAPDAKSLVVLPGSRMSEVERIGPQFRGAVDRLAAQHPLHVIIPVVPGVRARVEALFADAPCPVSFISGDEAKFAAFTGADAALAASGTVTLELAVSGCPMVVGYDVDLFARQLRFLVQTDAFALANLVLGEKAFPELMVEECEPVGLAREIGALLDRGSPQYRAQRAALDRIAERMAVPGNAPSTAAAQIIAGYLPASYR
ncbi:MAG: lipid-A-disaccharide synthase [Pseudomonadota bacterium]